MSRIIFNSLSDDNVESIEMMTEEADFSEVVDLFKRFLLATGYQPDTVDQLHLLDLDDDDVLDELDWDLEYDEELDELNDDTPEDDRCRKGSYYNYIEEHYPNW